MPGEHQSESSRTVRGRGLTVMVVAGTLIAAGLGVGAFSTYRSAGTVADERTALHADDATAEFQTIVDELAWSHLDSVADVVERLSTDRSDPVDWEELALRRDELVEQLDALRSDEQVGPAAAELADEIRDLAETGVDDIEAADNVHWAAMFHDDDGSGFLGLAPQLVAIDPAVAVLRPRLEELPDSTREYVDSLAEYAVEVPGWLFGDADHPFADPILPDSVDGGPGSDGELPAEALQITELAGAYTSGAATRLWDTDLWWTENADYGPLVGAPHDLDDVFADADVVSDDLRSAIRADDRVDAAERSAEIESLGRDITVRRLVAALLAVLAVVALVPATVAVIRRVRAMSVDSMTDPLTGAWNRRVLDSAMLRRGLSARVHRVVAVTDLDRFKLVNDSWGHAVGDEVLREAVRRLRARVDDLVDDGLAAEGWVIRTGGDEFVIVLSSDDAIDTKVVVDRVRSIAGRVDVGHLCDAPGVELMLSVGAVTSDRSTDDSDLDAMITAADLVAYEDKATRGHSSPPLTHGPRRSTDAST